VRWTSGLRAFALYAALVILPLQNGLAAGTVPVRLAVVIANAQYAALGTLKNPIADGRLVADALRKQGFKVRVLENLTNDQFRDALRVLAGDSEKADVTLVYYAGHGAQIGGVNYLIPVDLAAPQREQDVHLGSVSADDVMGAINSTFKILVLDACRDNPNLSRSLSKGRGVASIKSGLAAPSDTSNGVFIAYSTKADAVALDGEGVNSPFAEAFADNVGYRGSIYDMFSKVTGEVVKTTKGLQRPFAYSSLDGMLCISGECGTPALQSTSGSQPAASVDATAVADAFKRLNAAKSSDVRAKIEQSLWEQFRARLPPILPYGEDATGPHLATNAFGFASAISDGHRASATVYNGTWGTDGYYTFLTNPSADLVIDCDHQTFTRSRTQTGNDIQLFTQAEQKANAKPIDPHNLLIRLALMVCSAPIRLTPLGAVDKLAWVDIGNTYSAAPAIRYRVPSSNDTWYLLTKFSNPTPTAYNAVLFYQWMGINCRTREVELGQYVGEDKDGNVVQVMGQAELWHAAKDNSAAANARVILCDQ
jgi:uncharacterized caspase-like protein